MQFEQIFMAKLYLTAIHGLESGEPSLGNYGSLVWISFGPRLHLKIEALLVHLGHEKEVYLFIQPEQDVSNMRLLVSISYLVI